MVQNDALTEAVRAALDAWPLSRRELASRSRVPNTTLVKIAGGGLGASEEVARRLLEALDSWHEEQRAAAKSVASARGSMRRELRRTQAQSRRSTDGT